VSATTKRRRQGAQTKEPRTWRSNHFSLANPKGANMDDVPRLLERLAATVRAYGDIEVQDITFHREVTSSGVDWPSFTVYWSKKRKR